MQASVEALAKLVDGTVRGDGAVLISAARPITEAGPGQITFVEDDRHAKLLSRSNASAAVVGLNFPAETRPLILVAEPLGAFVRIFEHFEPSRRPEPSGIHPQASISPTSQIGADASVGPFAVVGDDVTIGERCRILPGAFVADGCRLGNDVTLHANVVLYHDTIVGDRVTIHAGTVIGANGFGYRTVGGRHVPMPQFGRVEIGNDVEIGANTTIDRGTFYVTRIGDGTKIDNLVQVAHNCRLGRHNLIVSQVGIAGSSKTGDYVIVAGQAGIKDHTTIGDRSIVEAMAGVMEDIPAGETWVGAPAMPARAQFRLFGLIRKLPELREQLFQLAKQVEDLEQRMGPMKKSA